MQAKKPSFLSNDHALLTAMVQLGDPESCVTLIRNSAASGAEAFFSGWLSRAEPLRGSCLGSGSESKSI